MSTSRPTSDPASSAWRDPGSEAFERVVALLSDEQVSAYLGAPAPDPRAAAVGKLREGRRRAVAEAEAEAEVPGHALEELREAGEMAEASGRPWTHLAALARGIGFVTGWGFLVLGVVAIVTSSGPLIGWSALCLAVAYAFLFPVASTLRAAAARRTRTALLAWAVPVPGRLERGLPTLDHGARPAAAGALHRGLGLVLLAAGAFCVVMGVVMLAVAAFAQELVSLQIAGVLLAAGALAVLGQRLVTRWARRAVRRALELRSVLGWVYERATAEAAGSPRS